MNLSMSIRAVDTTARTVSGIVAPYDEISYLTPEPKGERIMRGAFKRSARERASKVLLFREHDHTHPVGRAVSFSDSDEGLQGDFAIRSSELGDAALADIADGYLPQMSVGFKAIQSRRAADGAAEIVEAMLVEVSLVAIGAYEGARVLAVRGAHIPWLEPADLEVNFAPLLPAWMRFR
jgi:HK97 family phage prohead protease